MLLSAGKFQWARPGTISTREFLNDILFKTFLAGLVLPWLFGRLGSRAVFEPYAGQARSLLNKLATVWPGLDSQYGVVLTTLGEGQAASFAFFGATLGMLPAFVLLIAFSEYRTRRADILAAGRREVLIILILAAVVPLMLSAVGSGVSEYLTPYRQFRADKWGLFYFQVYWFFFVFVAAVTYLIFLLGRLAIDRRFGRFL